MRAALLLLALLAAPALAQDVTTEALDAADLDGDGILSQMEFDAAVAGVRQRLDLNGDGFLDRQEFGEGGAFDPVDADGDGKLSSDEFAASAQRDFDAADLDGDGALGPVGDK